MSSNCFRFLVVGVTLIGGGCGVYKKDPEGLRTARTGSGSAPAETAYERDRKDERPGVHREDKVQKGNWVYKGDKAEGDWRRERVYKGDKAGGDWRRERVYEKKAEGDWRRERPKEGETDYPPFPWPPPPASATTVLPREFFESSPDMRLGDVEARIRHALDANGYSDKSYYAVPDGFAMVTRLEQIYEDGRPLGAAERWAIKVAPLKKFSLEEYLKALFLAKPGYFRAIVFVVTSSPFTQKGASVKREDVTAWLESGLNVLPESIGQRKFSAEFACTALIYEFEQKATNKPALQRRPGRLTAAIHLAKSNLWAALQR